MLVILLSMLTTAGLNQESEFLLRTYGIGSSNRTQLELLFLKVIPLRSISARVFLSSLFAAVLNYEASDELLNNEEAAWYQIVYELAKRGYLIPSMVESLSGGDKIHSWMPVWPSGGYHSSHVFGRLQQHGRQLKGFNEIIPVRITTDSNVSQLTVYLHDSDQPYIVDLHDYEDIQAMKPGHYNLCEVDNPDRVLGLHIRQETLNDNINRAIHLLNKIIARMSSHARKSPGKLQKALFNRQDLSYLILGGELRTQAPITRHEAVLGDASTYMAVAWKCDGKSINKMDMLNRMDRSATRIRAVLRSHEKHFSRRDVQQQQTLTLLSNHEEKIRIERNNPRIASQPTPDSPIRRTIYPNDDLQRVDPNLWYEYESGIRRSGPQSEVLFIISERDMVKAVRWNFSAATATIELARLRTKFTVSPIQLPSEFEANVEDHYAVEIEQGDTVLLCGRYLVVVTPAQRELPPICEGFAFEMTNWMEILKVDTHVQRRRREHQVMAQRFCSYIL